MTDDAKIEVLVTQLNEELTQIAFEKFTNGDIDSNGLRHFYQVLREWSEACEKVVDLLQRSQLSQRKRHDLVSASMSNGLDA